MAKLDWDWLLDPANGGPGGSPGYAEAAAAQAQDTRQRPRRKGKSKKAQWTGLKHGSTDP